MRKRIPSRQNPVEHYVRREHAERSAGLDAQCACGERRAEALITGSQPVTCIECSRLRKGRRTIDLHHIAGRTNDPTVVPVSANDHVADLSERQQDWPRETLENPHRCPLLRAAACIRGFVDTVFYLIERTLLWTAEALEALSAWLAAKLGPLWYRGTPVERFACAGKER